MDKKKVIELIEKGMLLQSKSSHVSAYKEKAKKCFNEALTELQKPDWISVENELPDYNEDVLVCNKEEPSDMWFGHRTPDRRVVVDEHEFAKGYGTITHWRRIDKLEE